MNLFDLEQAWLREEQGNFEGWDFSHLNGRWEEEALPWDYREMVGRFRRAESRLLDMGTGGGEFLLSLGHPYRNTAVTESWEPNIALCRKRLEPLGIRVCPVAEVGNLPFENDSFDLIINRHASYEIGEVRRILKPGGIFVTEQVGGENNRELSLRLIPSFQPIYGGFCLKREKDAFLRSGFRILEQKEAFPLLHFLDIGAVVYFARAIPWEFPGFSVSLCREKLFALQRELGRRGSVESREHRFILAARNMKS